MPAEQQDVDKPPHPALFGYICSPCTEVAPSTSNLLQYLKCTQSLARARLPTPQKDTAAPTLRSKRAAEYTNRSPLTQKNANSNCSSMTSGTNRQACAEQARTMHTAA